jgi:HSP90 family molecular chaperone
MSILKFTVDSALLEELGERLVDKPYIALAELVKNAYDADAGRVTIKFNLGKNRVVVADDGSGMTFDEFRSFWMCVGSTHKQQQRLSRRLKRLMTGSKGVGRFAVQLLAEELEIQTARSRPPPRSLPPGCGGERR